MIADTPIEVIFTITEELYREHESCFVITCHCKESKVTHSLTFALEWSIFHLREHQKHGLLLKVR